MFEKSLQDLVKGIRSNKAHASLYISQAIAECKQELRQSDAFVKANAIRKLTFLHMLGYDMSWAAFYVLEVMSQPRFCHKREGYLAACVAFGGNLDVLLLTTNLFKKEFMAPSQYEAALAINCLSNVVNGELARNLLGDVVALTSHSRAYVRKKGVLALYKLYTKYPQALRLTFDKLAARLDDEEPSVVSAAVNVICELANKNPRNYLALAPQFFRLMTSSSNNWMLIKVVKLLGSLVSEEPRLARKLLEPLTTIISHTAAKSLQYECIHTLTLALPFTKRNDGSDAKNAPQVVALCSRILQQFVEDPDQNLKYLGLVGLVELMRSHPRAVLEHKALVLHCLDDDDVTIRSRALELLTGMVTRRTLVELVHQLLGHVGRSEGRYRDEIVEKIIFMCSREKYSFLADFDWYLGVLVTLTKLPGLPGSYSPKIAAQLIEVCIRVADVRSVAVTEMAQFLLAADVMNDGRARARAEVFRAAAFILGEYLPDLPEDELLEGLEGLGGLTDWGGGYGILLQRLVKVLLHPAALRMPPEVLRAFGTSAFKIFAALVQRSANGEGVTSNGSSDASAAAGSLSDLREAVEIVRSRAGAWLLVPDPEVHARMSNLMGLLGSLGLLPRPDEDATPDLRLGGSAPLTPDALLQRNVNLAAPKLRALFVEPLLPVNVKAQRRVPMPEDLDLDEAFSAPVEKSLYGGANGVHMGNVNFSNADLHAAHAPRPPPAAAVPTHVPRHGRDSSRDSAFGHPAAHPPPQRSATTEASPFMLGRSSDASRPPGIGGSNGGGFGGDDFTSAEGEGKRRRRKKDKKARAEQEVIVYKEDIMPAGAAQDEDPPSSPRKADDALSSIDITRPLQASERHLDPIASYPNPHAYPSAPIPARMPDVPARSAAVPKPKREKKAKKARREKPARQTAAASAPSSASADLLDLSMEGMSFGDAAPMAFPPGPGPAAAATAPASAASQPPPSAMDALAAFSAPPSDPTSDVSLAAFLGGPSAPAADPSPAPEARAKEKKKKKKKRDGKASSGQDMVLL